MAAAGAAANPASGEFARRLRALALLFFAAALAVALYAAAERRAFYADGAHYLVRLAQSESFDFSEPARLAALALLQGPTVLAMRLGLVDLAGAGLVYCATLELAPLALLALCWAALPAAHRHFFYFPLLAHLAGTMSASAAPVLEGLVAVAYFWLLLALVAFRPLGRAGLAGFALLALPTLVLNEVMAGLAPALALAAAWRARGAATRGRRLAFAALALWFAAVALAQAGFVLAPRSPENRANVLTGFFEFWWLIGRGGAINFPAWLGLIALLALNLVSLTRRLPGGGRESRAAWILAALFAAAAAGSVAAAAALPATVFPFQHFAARLGPALVSLALAAGLLGSLWKPARQAWWTRSSVLAICAALAAGTLAWHAVAIGKWSDYLGIVRGVLAGQRGLVAPQSIEARLAGRERIVFRSMKWPWAFPELSIALAPGGRVATIIDRESRVAWETWYPRDPDQLPKSRLFDTAEYRRALARQPPR